MDDGKAGVAHAHWISFYPFLFKTPQVMVLSSLFPQTPPPAPSAARLGLEQARVELGF